MPLFYYVSDHEKDAMHKPLDAERLLRMLGASGKLAGFRQAAYMIERVRENPKGAFWPRGASCARNLPGAQSWRPCFIPKMRWKSARSLPLCRASIIW